MPRRSEDVDRDAYDAAIAAEVRAAFARARVAQKDVAERFGWDRNYLGKRMLGQVPFGIPDLTKICDLLEIDMAELLGKAKRTAQEGRAGRAAAG